MLRRSLLLFCLLLTSLIASTAVHANEFASIVTIECSGEIHVANDADPLPGDADRGVPHHHGGCHGHNLCAPVSGSSHIVMGRASDTFYLPASDMFARRAVGPVLRPPIA
ncbi:MAG: hypothetical protein AB7E60_06500 [Sphingobium sp.]